MIKIGDRIKAARAARGWSQQRLAEAVGISRAAISQWESGESQWLKPDNLLAAAEGLNVRIEWLVTGEEPMRPAPPLTAPERAMLAIFRELSAEKQQALLNFLGGTFSTTTQQASAPP